MEELIMEMHQTWYQSEKNNKTPKKLLPIVYSFFSLNVWQRWNAPLNAKLVFARLVVQTLNINILAPN